jgi:hypothetical protein
MDVRYKYQIFGLNMVTLGKFKELIFNIKFILVEKFVKLLIIKATKDHIGKKLKLFWREHMILQFQAMPLLIR